jgi:cytochrome c oxidase cbb3-type subunit 1
VLDWLWPRIVRRNWHSNALRSWHFWLSTVGITIMFFDLMIAGLVHGFMQRELNHWTDILQASVPFWWVRTFAGGMMLAGLLCMLYNMWATVRSGRAYEEERHLVPAEAS